MPFRGMKKGKKILMLNYEFPPLGGEFKYFVIMLYYP